MQKALLIAEKPDLMRKIEKVYSENKKKIPYSVDFFSQRGHLVTLLSPSEMDEDLKKWTWDTLPIEPEEYEGWKYKIIQEEKTGKYLTAKERYEEILTALEENDYDFVIHAGDPDQEGQLLVDIVLSHMKNKLPVKRFWTNDLTDSHILNALQNLKDNDHDPMLTNLLAAAQVRQHSDWRFGMNVSRASTLKMNYRVSCGRVKTPILAIVCKREEEIRNFKPVTVYGVKAKYKEGFEGSLFNKNEISEDEDKKDGIVWFKTKAEAENLIDTLPDTGIVRQYITKRTETYAPKLYKLATAQVDAGKLGYNDSQTLEIIQKLYEQEYISYPRTDCEYLSSNEDFEDILNALSCVDDFVDICDDITAKDIAKVKSSKRWINDKALEDSGHSALRPTTKAPDFASLSKAEIDIYTMISKRFLAIFLPPLVQDKTAIVTDVGGSLFSTTGSTLIDPGYTTLLGRTFNDTELPKMEKGDTVNVEEFEVTEKTSTCPKRYTSPDIINVCENPAKFLNDASLKKLGKKLKIGTPATRSGIIRQLIDVDHYLEEKKDKKTTYIVPTELGERIIKNLDGLMICRVDMTGEWEEMLEDIRSGNLGAKDAEKMMRSSVREMLKEIKNRDMIKLGSSKEPVGKCPQCGGNIYESEKGFYCENYKNGCLSMFKKSLGVEFDINDYMKFANDETVEKSGREFHFDYSQKKIVEKADRTDIICPMCGMNLLETPDRYRCDCGFSTIKVIGGHKISRKDLEQLELRGSTDPIEDFVSKTGKSFTAILMIDNSKKTLKFDFGAKGDETDYKCPCCKKKYLKESEKQYKCDCGFVIWKTMAQHEFTKEEIADISTEGRTRLINDFVSKKGSNFSARAKVDKKKKTVVFDFD